jgi:hypothetical protein
MRDENEGGFNKRRYLQDYFTIIKVMKGEDVAVDKTEWTEIRDMVGMKAELDDHKDWINICTRQ